MKLLVVGGTGWIGSAVTRRLAAAGHEPVVVARGETSAELPAGVRRLVLDRRRAAEHAAALRAERADVAIDLNALVLRDTMPLLEVLPDCVGRHVLVSSCDVYRVYGQLQRLESAPPAQLPLDEDAPLRTSRHPYRRPQAERGADPSWRDDYDKIPIEEACREAGFEQSCVVRLPMVYGPGDPQRRLAAVLQRVRDGRAALVLERAWAQWRSTWGFIDDVADAITAVATAVRPPAPVYNAGEPEHPTSARWTEAVLRAAGSDARVVVAAAPALPASLRGATEGLDLRHDLVCSSARLRRDLGYTEKVGAREGLARAARWELAQPAARIRPDYAAEDAFLASHPVPPG